MSSSLICFACFVFVAQAQDDVLDLIKSSGYKGEAYQVETEDGYLLKIHRVLPTVKNTEKFPVFLMHGLFATAADYLITGPQTALAFLLADKGYDVWLGNARGNKHSMNHRDLSINSSEFWNFSFHEIGVYDLSAMIDFMLNTTNCSQLFYVGHSQGASAAMVLLSLKPEYNEKIIQAHLMGPAVFMGHFQHFFVKLVGGEIENGLLSDYSYLNFEDILFQGNSFKELFCSDNQTWVCALFTFAIFGANKHEIEIETNALLNLNRYVSPRVSINQLVHFNQLIVSGKFQQFDYNRTENLACYGLSNPPEYPLENVKTKVYLYHASEDFIISKLDVDHLNETLPNVAKYRTIPNWNHGDFVYGKNTRRLLYRRILRAFQSVKLRNE